MKRTYLQKHCSLKIQFSRTVAAAILCIAGAGISLAGPKGSQFLTAEKLQDAKTLDDAVSEFTGDYKGKFFGKLKKIVIPTYYIEFRTTSSGKSLKKGLLGQHGVAANATVTYANPDKAVMESIATAGLADLKARFAAAGYEVAEPGDVTKEERFKKLTTLPSGTITESTAKPIGLADFKSMFAAAEGAAMYFVVPGEPAAGTSGILDSMAADGVMWKAAGGEGVGVIRSRMMIDFVNFSGDSGVTYGDKGFKDYANISAAPQVRAWLASLCVTRTYIFWGERIAGDDFGCISIKPEVDMASTATADSLGKLDDKGGKWIFTANNDKYKEAALEQIKVANAVLVAKAKSLK